MRLCAQSSVAQSCATLSFAICQALLNEPSDLVNQTHDADATATMVLFPDLAQNDAAGALPLRHQHAAQLAPLHHLAPRIAVACEDGLVTLQRLPPRCVRLIIVDPPFGFFSQSHGHAHWQWDKPWTDVFWQQLMVQIRRVLAANGRFLIFGVRDFSDHVCRMVRPQVSGSDLTFQRLIWHHGEKTNCQNPHMLLQDYEEILCYSLKDQRERLRKPSAVRNAQLTTFVVARDPLDSNGVRPTMKPLELMEKLILNMTEANDLVLDITANNHVSGRAAHLHGRRYLGIERDATRYRAGVAFMQDYLSSHCPVQHAQVDRTDAVRLRDALKTGIAAAEGLPSLTLTLEGREYMFYGWNDFEQVRSAAHDPSAQTKSTITIYRGEPGLLALLRRALPGFDAVCTLAEQACPLLQIGFVHGLIQSCAQACLDWHVDRDTIGYKRVQKTVVTCLTDTDTSLDVEDTDGAVHGFRYNGGGSTIIFDAGLRHRSGPASEGTLKVALMLVPRTGTAKRAVPPSNAKKNMRTKSVTREETGTQRSGRRCSLRSCASTSMVDATAAARTVKVRSANRTLTARRPVPSCGRCSCPKNQVCAACAACATCCPDSHHPHRCGRACETTRMSHTTPGSSPRFPRSTMLPPHAPAKKAVPHIAPHLIFLFPRASGCAAATCVATTCATRRVHALASRACTPRARARARSSLH